MTIHGPGIEWLAQRAGMPPEALVKDRTAMLRSLADAGRDAASLAARLESGDPAVRRAAEAEARLVRARFSPPPGEPTSGSRLASHLTEALRAETARQRNAQSRAPDEQE